MVTREDGGAVSTSSPRPKPSASSVIKDGAVAGDLPEAEAFAVHHPAYPSSTSRAIETLGGLSEIAKARSSESSYLELRFRPEDPHSHPAFGDLRPAAGLLLRISKTRSEAAVHDGAPPPAEQISAGIVARVSQAYHFEGMVDYQYVPAVHAAESTKRKRHDLENDEDMDMIILPQLFSLKDKPEKIVLNSSTNLLAKNMQKAVVEHHWEMDIEPCLGIDFDIERIPMKVNWEDNIPKETNEWKSQMAISKLFEERPIWWRRSLHERLLDDGLQVTDHQMRRLLLRSGYYFSKGPFGRLWIRKGYDPRKDPESRIFQRVDFRVPHQLRNLTDVNMNPSTELKQTREDICRFQVFPSNFFIWLQLFELVDDFIQQEIRKPIDQTTCTRLTGWFSRAVHESLRLRVKIRFLSIFPYGGAEDLLKSTSERFKRMQALSKFWKPEKEHQQANQGSDISAEMPSAKSNGAAHELDGQDEQSNFEVENYQEEEEEEEEQDGYESPHVASEDGTFSVDASSYQFGESIPNSYLQEVLRGLPFGKDGKDSQPDGGLQGADLSDGEYQIYEQDSDDEYDDEDGFS